MKEKIDPKEILLNGAIDAAKNEVEKLIFPKPAKTIWGKIARIGTKILMALIPKVK